MRGFYQATIFDCPPFTMFDNDDDPRAGDILVEKKFELQSMKLWCRFVPHASSILDIGAHTGVYSLAAAALRSDVPIHAFEPNPYAAARLRLHKHLNGFANIRDRRLAIADQSGVTTIAWGERDGGFIPSGSTVIDRAPQKKHGKAVDYVEMATLDTTVPDPGHLPLIKIDVEGAERLVFNGMPKTLALRPIIFLEIFNQLRATAINELLKDYRIFRIHEAEGPVETGALRKVPLDGAGYNQLLLPAEHFPLLP